MSKNIKKVNTDQIKKYTIATFVVVGVLFIGLSWFFRSGSDDEAADEPNESGEELIIEDDRDKLIREQEAREAEEAEEDNEPEDVNESSRNDARKNLQQTDETLEDSDDVDDEMMEQLNNDLVELFSVYEKDHDFDGNFYTSKEFYTTIASGTEIAMSRQIDTAIKVVGYEADIDSAEWYKTNVENVYQFLVSLKAEGYDDLVFSGNYNNKERVFNVVKMDGILNLDDFAS